MRRIHIVGFKNHGKTSLIEDLIPALLELGLRVGSIKHSPHDHELDTPGKDSHRHRKAGASIVGLITRSMNAIFVPADDQTVGRNQIYTSIDPMFADCDLVIVEGDQQTLGLKIEVWREGLETEPIASNDSSIEIIVTDDCNSDKLRNITMATIRPRSDVAGLAAAIKEKMDLG